MCQAMEDMRNQTLKECMTEAALRMLKAGKYALDEIAAISGLSPDEINELKGRNADICSYCNQKK